MSDKTRVKELRSLVKDCESIEGFNKRILNDYKSQLGFLEKKMKDEKELNKQRRKALGERN